MLIIVTKDRHFCQQFYRIIILIPLNDPIINFIYFIDLNHLLVSLKIH